MAALTRAGVASADIITDTRLCDGALARAATMIKLDPNWRFELVLLGCAALLIGVVVFVIFR
jgi:hypothetical protein